MDFSQLIMQAVAPLFNAAVIAGAVAIGIKIVFEKSLDAKFESYLERQRAEIQEESRRKTALHDQQVPVLKKMLKLIQASIDDIHIFSQPDEDEDLNCLDANLQAKYRDLRQYLRDNNIYLPNDVYVYLDETVELISEFLHSGSGEMYTTRAARCEKALSARYQHLVQLLQGQLYVQPMLVGKIEKSVE